MAIEKDDVKKLCSDCRDNFYNIGNNSSTGECWALESKVVAENIQEGNGVAETFVVGINTEWPDKNSYSIGKRPVCWSPKSGSGLCKWKAPV